MVYDNGTKLWELTNRNGRIHFNKPKGEQVQKYFKNWEGKLKGPLIVTVDRARFEQARVAQEAREGQPYRFYRHNSNYAVRGVINQSITYGIGAAPEGNLGWAPDFIGDPTK